MNLVSIDSVSKSRNEKLLFENVSFGIDSGEKIALIGVNGCGKSTLLSLIAGDEPVDKGIIARNRECRITFLKQMPDFNPEDTIIDHIFRSDAPAVKLIKRYEELCEDVAESHDEKLRKELDDVMLKMQQMDAWQYEFEIRSILGELGIHGFHAKMKELSGGMLKKVALAQALIDDATLLIMDEPTNHLDVETVAWLEDYLARTNRALLFVTHDRYFLDNIATRIIEIDRKQAYSYPGNYGTYLEKKAEHENALAREEERVRSILRMELAWLSVRPKARTCKQRARIDRAEEMKNRPKEAPKQELALEVQGRRLGSRILELKEVTKSFGDKRVVAPFSYTFRHAERVGIVGPNGAGKSTLMKLFTGQLTPDSGEVEIGANTVFGVFDQHSEHLDPNDRIIEHLKGIAEVVMLKNGKYMTAGQMLERFLFPSDMHYRPISTLSGGEKRRLHLVSELMKNPNFLLLDEPTNDLDIKTLSVFEDFLSEFPGCIAAVSHDRYFLDRVTEHLFVLDGSGQIRDFPGGFDEYLELREKEKQEQKRQRKEEAAEKAPEKPQEKKRKLSYKEQQELIQLEKDIASLEAEQATLAKLLNSGGSNYDELAKAGKRSEEIDDLLLMKMERWEELSSISD